MHRKDKVLTCASGSRIEGPYLSKLPQNLLLLHLSNNKHIHEISCKIITTKKVSIIHQKPHQDPAHLLAGHSETTLILKSNSSIMFKFNQLVSIYCQYDYHLTISRSYADYNLPNFNLLSLNSKPKVQPTLPKFQSKQNPSFNKLNNQQHAHTHF